MLNSVNLQGRLTRDVELRYTKTDKAVASFTIACDGYRDKEADFTPCVAWEKTALFIAKYFGKGDMIIVEGRLCSRQYEDKDGKKRTTYEVLVSSASFCERKKSDSSEPEYDGPPTLTESDDESDLPF